MKLNYCSVFLVFLVFLVFIRMTDSPNMLESFDVHVKTSKDERLNAYIHILIERKIHGKIYPKWCEKPVKDWTIDDYSMFIVLVLFELYNIHVPFTMTMVDSNETVDVVIDSLKMEQLAIAFFAHIHSVYPRIKRWMLEFLCDKTTPNIYICLMNRFKIIYALKESKQRLNKLDQNMLDALLYFNALALK